MEHGEKPIDCSPEESEIVTLKHTANISPHSGNSELGGNQK